MSSPELWSAVDDYIVDHLAPEAADLEYVSRASQDAGLPPIAVSPAQGKLLHLLARMQRARTILELGTLGGYSTIWLARALPAGGRLITLEADPRCAAVARANIARAALRDQVELRLGPALDTLPQLADEGAGPFDLIFIDADKQHMPDYFLWALRLARPGTAIVGDNVVRGGRVLDPGADDPSLIRGVRGFYELLSAKAAEGVISATAIQTVGAKEYDGFALAIVGDAQDQTGVRPTADNSQRQTEVRATADNSQRQTEVRATADSAQRQTEVETTADDARA